MSLNMPKFLPLLILAIAISGCGITSRGLKSDPGFAHMQFPSLWEADKEVSLSLGPTVLGFAAVFIDEDEDFAELIQGIKGINLRVYKVTENSELLSRYVIETSDQLNNLGWQQLAAVREDDESTFIMVKLEEEIISGLVVLALDNNEAVFINLIGEISPESIRPIVAQIYKDLPVETTEI